MLFLWPRDGVEPGVSRSAGGAHRDSYRRPRSLARGRVCLVEKMGERKVGGGEVR